MSFVSDGASSARTTDQVPMHPGHAAEHPKQLVSLDDLIKEFKDGQQKGQDMTATAAPSGFDRNALQLTNNGRECQGVLDILSNFDITGAAKDNVHSHKTAKTDTVASFSDPEIAKLFKHAKPASETLSELLKELKDAGVLTKLDGHGKSDGHSIQSAHRAGDSQIQERIPHDQPSIDPAHFSEVAKRLVDKIGHNHEVTKDDLVKAMQDHSIKGEDAQVLAAMYKNFDNLKDLSGWHLCPRINFKDLDAYQKMQAAHDNEKAVIDDGLKDWAQHSLAKFPASSQWGMTHDDLEKALPDPKINKEDRRNLEFIEKHWSEMAPNYRETVLPNDVANFVDSFKKNEQTNTVAQVEGVCDMVATRAQKADISHKLYEGDPLESIKHADIKQGTIGDCYFEATLAALAKSDPEKIQKLIQDNHDGTYTVDFPGRQPWERPVTVTAPTEAEMGLYNGGSKYGCWASVLEKAYGQYRENQVLHFPETPDQGGDGGGMSPFVFHLLTGKFSDQKFTGITSEADMSKALHEAFNSKPPQAVTGAIFKDLLGSETTADGCYREHVYTITKIYTGADGKEYVEIRNPWDRHDLPKGAKFSLPLSDFMHDFGMVSIEGR